MSLYIDRAITRDDSAIQVDLCWHPKLGLAALGAFSEERGGTVDLVDRFGYLVDDGRIPPHPTAQTSCLAWHPTKKLLVIGWESGDLYLYVEETCLRVDTSHGAAPIHLAKWNADGSMLVTADKNGSVIGWRSDGAAQLDMVFHHELKDSLTSITFPPAPKQQPVAPGGQDDPEMSLSGLARAAVAGDERALDLFSSWRPSDANRFRQEQQRHSGNSRGAGPNTSFAGSSRGVIYCLSENGSCMEVLQAEGAVRKLTLTSRNELVVVTESMVIGQFRVERDGTVAEISRVKLSTRTKENHLAWVDDTHLAVNSGDMTVRVWNLKTDANFVLTTEEQSGAQFITCLSYCAERRLVAAGTNSGSIVMWRCANRTNFDEEESWRPLPSANVGTAVRSLEWGGGGQTGGDVVCALNTVRQVFFLYEQERAVAFHAGMTATQVTPTTIQLDFSDREKAPVRLSTNVSIEKIRLSESAMAVSGSGKVLVFEVQEELRHTLLSAEFQLYCDAVDVFEQSVVTMEANRVNIRSFQGTIKQTLTLTEAEGAGTGLQVQGRYLLVTTANHFVKIWDVSKREARLHVHPVSLKDRIPGLPSSIGEVRLNATGSLLSLCCGDAKNDASSARRSDACRIYVLDFEGNRTCYFNFNSGKAEGDDAITVPPNSAQSTGSTASSMAANAQQSHILGRYVVRHGWDSHESTFLVCQTRPIVPSAKSEEDLFVSMFFHDENGIIVHDSVASPKEGRLVGVSLPFIYLMSDNLSKSATSDDPSKKDGDPSVIMPVLMKDFEGLESSDVATREAVVSFCFHLSVGNMDEAFRAIKMITNKKIWGNLARMCVKSQRLDVATICLGKMEHATGARAMRKIMGAKVSKDIKIAILAIYLKMEEEAERILVRCGQYELLNKFYQDSDRWQKALEVAEKHDRIHLRSTFYNYAKHLENKFDVRGAIAYYEKSGTSKFEVPRLLFEDWNALESYVERTEDKSMKRWLAQYLESTGEMEAALHYYQLADDYLSLVRVHCYCENVDRAAEIANESGDKAACYHIARQYENADDVQAAIHFFSKAQAYSNAIRICKDHGFGDHVWNLALMGSPQDKLDAAKYFENSDKPNYENAVILYEKAGYFAKALDLAIATNQHGALLSISKKIENTSDPILATRAAGFFLENKQYEKAVELFIASRQCRKALELCLQYNITITEESAEALSVDESGNTNNAELLNEVASVCYRQGNYHLATKKWTQAGNRLQAMKALLKSGDTEKIIFFANVSRDSDIYILAANYLQTLDWRNNADVMKSIILFYQKAKAFELLGWFYQACADVEIDEYQNYEKALGALSECLKCFEKVPPGPKIEEKAAEIARNSQLISRFVEAQRSYSLNPEASVKACHELLQIDNLNIAVRKGDVYGFLIEHYARAHNYKTAKHLLDDLARAIPNVNLAYYVNTDVLRAIEQNTGIRLLPDNASGEASEHHFVEEDVVE